MRKYVKGNTRTVPSSSQKIKKRIALLYYKALKNKAVGKNVDERMMERRRVILGIDATILNQQQARQKYLEAVEEWEQYQKEAKQQREKEMLDMYPIEIVGDDEIIRKR